MYRPIALFIVPLCLVMLGGHDVEAATKRPAVRIGTVMDGPSQRLTDIGRLIQGEIVELTKGEFDVQFPDKSQLDGSWSVEGVRGSVDNLLANPRVDFVIGLGVIASNDLAQRKRLRKPAIAPFIIDSELQALPVKAGTSGVKNLNYLASFKSLERDMKTFREILPFTRMALLADQAILKAFPLVRKKIDRIARANRIRVRLIPVGASVSPVLKALPRDTDAVFITPLLRLPSKEFDRLISMLNGRRLPSFSLTGRREVERGVMAGAAPEEDNLRLARRVALNVQRILLGKDAGQLSVNFPVGERLTINMATVRKIDKWPSFRVLTEADLIKDRPAKVGRRMALYTAVREAISVNPDLAAADRKVAAGLGQVNQARAGLLPKGEVKLEGIHWAPKVTRGSLPLAEWGVRWQTTADVSLYSDDAWTEYSVEKKRQMSRHEDRRQVRLDTAELAAIVYLNVLRTKTTEQIQKENLQLTRTNLELARVRVSVGYARRDEVFRWENEIANGRIDVLNAQANRRKANVSLNRVLFRPLEELFTTEEAGLDDPLLLTGEKRLFAYIDNPRSFAVFRDFEVQEGIKASPEIRSLLAQISAQERKVLNTQRSYWLPTATANVLAFQRFAQAGSIGGGGDTAGDAAGLGAIAGGGGTSGPIYNAKIELSFPLFEGGSKDATQVRETEELRRLRLVRQSTVGRVEERLRSVLFNAGASFPSIRLSREAADAAGKNYDLVLDQYRRGQVDIIKLVDTQTNFINARLAAANAVYNFLIDLAGIQRAVGRFDYFMYRGERDRWFNRLDAFFRQAGVRPQVR